MKAQKAEKIKEQEKPLLTVYIETSANPGAIFRT